MQKSEPLRQDFKRSLGQNFLVDQGYLSLIAEAVSEGGTGLEILELAAGNGNLSEYLYPLARRIVALEIDEHWCEKLRRRFIGRPKVTVVMADARTSDLAGFMETAQNAILVGNLPYYAASPIMLRFREFKSLFSSFTVLVQKEVSERVAAGPGKKAYSVLSVLLSVDFKAEALFDIPASAFHPSPKVVSTLVRLSPRNDIKIDDRNRFVNLVKAAFFSRRKKIINSLTASGTFPDRDKDTWEDLLTEAKIDPRDRAEMVTVDKFVDLCKVITKTPS